jgi:hypothetical protein
MHLGQDFLLSVLAREHQQRDSANASKPGDIDLF